VLDADPEVVKKMRLENEQKYAESQNKTLSNHRVSLRKKSKLIEKILNSENSYCEDEFSKPKMNKV
jgi:hypothetical protein